MILAKLKEAIICLKAGRVTLPYPFKAHDPEQGFRGKIAVDPDKCFGCAGCANVCPARVIQVHDPEPDRRVLEFFWSRCTYCGRCEEVCPEDAITLTPLSETATEKAQDMYFTLDVFMGPCQRCGRCFPPPSALDKMMTTGFRNGNGSKRRAPRKA